MTPLASSTRSRHVAWPWLAAALATLHASAAVSTGPVWRPAPEPAGAVVAVAYLPPGAAGAGAGLAPDPGLPRLAVADRGVVWLGPAPERLAPVHRARGVRDLAFAADGALWIAGEDGLHRLLADGSLETSVPGAGARAREVSRIRAAGRLWLAATAAGVQAGDASGHWAPLAAPLPSGAATALAVWPAAAGAGLRVGAVIEGVAHWLWIPGPDDEPGSAAPALLARVGSGVEGARSMAADVWISPETGEAWTLLADGCVVGERGGCAPLPPGAEARRLFQVERRFWLSTDRGVLVADAASGPWEREGTPLGSLEAHAVAGGGGTLFAATERGLLVAAAPAGPERGLLVAAAPAGPERGLLVAAAPAGPATAALADLPARLLGEHGEPGIEEVRLAVIDYLDLGPERLRAMKRGAARRGWLPTLAFQLDHDRSVDRSETFDEAFVSGGLRSLFDRDRDRSSGFDASLSLEWDLGDVVYHPESVDVSREVRELLELRDDVLDEVRHLYFERRRVLLELLALPPDRPLDAARLRLRADELAAGIDAWTGGWFGRRAVRLSP